MACKEPTLRDVAVVFGGAGEGCGEAISRRFARSMHVIIADRNETRARDLAARINEGGGSSEAHPTDVQDRSAIARALGAATDRGSLRAIINNASAVEAYDPAAPLEHWDVLIDIDFAGTVHATRLGIDALQASGGGAIVNVSSTSALELRREGGSPMYDVCKAAVLLMSLRLGALGVENVRVNCIVPHWIAVPHIVDFVAGLSAAERSEYGVPDRLIPVEEIAETIYALATDRAKSSVAIIWPQGNAPRELTVSDFR